MTQAVGVVALLLSPFAIVWLGCRWARLIDRLATPARERAIEIGDARELKDLLEGATILRARVVDVAEVDDEILVQLTVASARPLAHLWLMGRVDRATVDTIERAKRRRAPVVVTVRDDRASALVDGERLHLHVAGGPF